MAQAVAPPPDSPLPDPVAWITSYFYIFETKAPITFAPYQQAALREALALDPVTGLFRYSTIVWSDLKKSAKTTIAGAVAMWMAWNRERATIRLVGNDLKQADSRVFDAIDKAIQLNPEWKKSIRIIRHLIELPNGSTIESVPVDPRGEAGGGDDMVEWTELAAARGKAHEDLWTELTLSPLKFGKSFRWTDTYAGFIGESKLLENLYEQGVKQGRRLDLSFGDHDLSDIEVFANDAARVFALWNTKPRLSWQIPQYYAQEATNLTESEFNRMHRNQWVVNAEEAFVPAEWWDACQRPTDLIPPLKNASLFVAMDAGISSDCFAMIAVSLHGETIQTKDDQGQPIVDEKGQPVLAKVRLVVKRFARAWIPPEGGQLEFRDQANPLNPDYPEGALLRLARDYNVVECAYDPYQLHDMAGRMAGRIRMYEFSQGAERMIADKGLRDSIRDKRVVHDGDEDLTQHVKNANVKTPEDGDIRKLSIVKRNQKLKIDLAVALSMANARALATGTLAEDWLGSLNKVQLTAREIQAAATSAPAQPAAPAVPVSPTPTPPTLTPEQIARALGVPQIGQPLKPPRGRGR